MTGFGVPIVAVYAGISLFNSVYGWFKGRSAKRQAEEYQRQYELAEAQRSAERSEAESGATGFMMQKLAVAGLAVFAVYALTKK